MQIEEAEIAKIVKRLNTSKRMYMKQVKEAREKGTPWENMLGVADGISEALMYLEPLLSVKDS